MDRRSFPIILCVALLQAFLMAPFQHVHLGEDHHGHGDHHESPLVHSHFYSAIPAEEPRSGPSFDHAHKAHASLALDTFTTLAHAPASFTFAPEAVAMVFAPAQRDICVETVEPRGHDPPCIASRIPRAPPL